jgi:hypothetical protein
MYAAGSLQGFKIVLSFAVFHGVLSEPHHLVDIAEDHGLGGGVDEAAGVSVQRLGEGEPGTGCCAIGKNLHRSSRVCG